MSDEAFIKQISDWHITREHRKIIETISNIPEQERSAELTCLLAQALINEDDFSAALKALDSVPEYFSNAFYCIRRGIALHQLHREHEAVDWFKKAREKGLEEINETPGTYLPKSVVKWIERAEKWAPRRIEQNAFEAQRRASRQKSALTNANLDDFDFEGFWNDCDYSLKEYVGNIPTDKDIADIETELGYRLPPSYKLLIKQHNGGMLQKNCFENPLQRDWTPENFGIEGIYGVDRAKPCSLCGNRGSKFWVAEWGYPDIGVTICDCPSGGHDMIFLDYSDCGPQGEPCVVHIDQESNYEITYLADNFDAFIRGLFPTSEDE